MRIHQITCIMTRLLVVLSVLWNMEGNAQDATAEAKANIDGLLEELANIGPEALILRFNELKAEAENLASEAQALRARADELDAKAVALRSQVQVIESFTQNLMASLNPPEPAAAPAPPAEPSPAPPPEATADASPPAEDTATESPPAQPAETSGEAGGAPEDGQSDQQG